MKLISVDIQLYKELYKSKLDRLTKIKAYLNYVYKSPELYANVLYKNKVRRLHSLLVGDFIKHSLAKCDNGVYMYQLAFKINELFETSLSDLSQELHSFKDLGFEKSKAYLDIELKLAKLKNQIK